MTGGQDRSGDAVRQLLAEIKQRADVASEGPWNAADEHGLLEGATPSWCVSRMRPGYKAMSETEGYLYDIAYTTGKAEELDAEFIAASRQDVPRLVAALTAVLDQCDEIEAEKAPLGETFGAGSRTAAALISVAVAAALQEQP